MAWASSQLILIFIINNKPHGEGLRVLYHCLFYRMENIKLCNKSRKMHKQILRSVGFDAKVKRI